MEIKPRQPTAKGPADWFIGDVWIDSIVQTQGQSTLNVAAVHFGPGSRTAWHNHDGGQTLYVTDGKDASGPEANLSSSSARATSCTRRPGNGTGMALPRIGS